MTAMSFISDKHIAKNKLQISFEHFVGDKILQLDSVQYKNELGQTFTVTKFKYYISNIHLTRDDGKEFVSKEFFLVNEEDEISKQIVMNDVPDGNYTSITFTIGVDSLHNCSGLQQGALDPVNGMFWAWNTGYIFLKLEGKSSQSKSPGNIFEYHIGGFREPNNCIREIKLAIGNVQLANRNTTSLKIKVDVAEILKSPTTINFSELSSVTDFHNATMVADNYKDMFSLFESK